MLQLWQTTYCLGFLFLVSLLIYSIPFNRSATWNKHLLEYLYINPLTPKKYKLVASPQRWGFNFRYLLKICTCHINGLDSLVSTMFPQTVCYIERSGSLWSACSLTTFSAIAHKGLRNNTRKVVARLTNTCLWSGAFLFIFYSHQS